MKILALITAKSTSLRVRGKNRKIIGGKPLYTWTTDFLMKHKKFFEDICFSTDVPAAFDVPGYIHKIKRPGTLCEDKTPHVMSVRHALLRMESRLNKEYDYVVLFQPTNPLRDKKDLVTFLTMMHDSGCELGKSYYVDENINPSYIEQAIKWDESTEPEGIIVRSGNMYAYSRKYLVVNELSKLDLESFYVIVPKHRGYNINNSEDFDVVEAFMRRYKCICKT
jgi:CMP-N-acetylneuraminic acid synthetase